MLSFKQILLKEDPDQIIVNIGDPIEDEKYIGYQDGCYTLLIYKDKVSLKTEWVVWDYDDERILSSNFELVDEVYNLTDKNIKTVEARPKSSETYGGVDMTYIKVNIDLDNLRDSIPSHFYLRSILLRTRRIKKNIHYSHEMILNGRVFKHGGYYYIPFWEDRSSTILRETLNVFLDFLKKVNISKDKVFLDSGAGENAWKPFEYFLSTGAKDVEKTPEQKRMQQMKFDLHANKAQLDKAIVQALQTRPKDVNTLYQRLEKQFGMPIVQIKHIFGAIPLDKLISKKIKELNERLLGENSILKETILDWGWLVGIVDSNGSVVIPHGQSGDSMHDDFGFGRHLYKFRYAVPVERVYWYDETGLDIEQYDAVERKLKKMGYNVKFHSDIFGKKIDQSSNLTEGMFPSDFDRHSIGSCMGAAALATDYLLSKGRVDFKVVEGMVSLYPSQEHEDFSPHTWIQFSNGKIFDPTKKQWQRLGFNPSEVKFEKVTRTYTPEEYQKACCRQPEDLSKFKKLSEELTIEAPPKFLYHATYEPLMNSIREHGIVPGGKDVRNFDWSKDFVYLAGHPNNAISFVEVGENEDIPEDWLGQIVVLKIDVSKLDSSKLEKDSHWNVDPGNFEKDDDSWKSYQYNGIIPVEAIIV